MFLDPLFTVAFARDCCTSEISRAQNVFICGNNAQMEFRLKWDGRVLLKQYDFHYFSSDMDAFNKSIPLDELSA